MSKAVKILIVVGLVLVIGVVVTLKQQGKEALAQPAATGEQSETAAQPVAGLPRLVDLGAGKCIPCKMMKPILDDLMNNYHEQFKVTFIDVWENPQEADKYNVKIIPTQVFYDAEGNELFRHEGFYSKEDILGKWKELGIDIEKGANDETNKI